MLVTDIIPYFIVMPILVLIGSLIAKKVHFFKEIINDSLSRKYNNLDGLRGFLATAVMIHHSVGYYYLFSNGAWVPENSKFYQGLAMYGVSFFFMITGFLFWIKIMQCHGNLDARQLFISRFKRLAPMMLDRHQVGEIVFKNKPIEDFLLWCELTSRGFVIDCMPRETAFYRLVPGSRGRNKFKIMAQRWKLLKSELGLSGFKRAYYFLVYFLKSFQKQKHPTFTI